MKAKFIKVISLLLVFSLLATVTAAATSGDIDPEITYDSSLLGTLDTFDDRNFEFPYVFTFLRFILNNITNVIIYAFRFIL